MRLLALPLLLLLQGCPPSRCDADGDGFESLRCGGEDCNDADSGSSPVGEERCDGLDNDCDGAVDGPDASGQPTWFQDLDGDLFGDPAQARSACDRPPGYAAEAGDCDDTRTLVNPLATEACNGIDDDCDGTIDGPDAILPSLWYADLDGDGWGDPASTTEACAQPPDTADAPGDCDDSNPAAWPGAPEICDGVDTDCDGVLDGTWYLDGDGDGFGDALLTTDACEPPPGYTGDATDCDDGDPATWPGAPELCGDGLDNDCAEGHDGACGAFGSWATADLPVLLDDVGHGLGGVALAAGDLNGDGVTDLAVTYGDPDEVVVHAGPFVRGEPPVELLRIVDPDEQRIGDFGATLLIADADGDGFDDLLIARAHPDDATALGEIELHLGPLLDAVADATISAPDRLGFGSSLAVLPDATGDGLPDLAVGVLDGDPASASWGGELFVFEGPIQGDLTPDDAVGWLTGWTGGLGWSLLAGDFDGDGLSDLAAGLPAGGADEGHVTVFVGPLTGNLTQRVDGSVVSGGEGRHFGASLAFWGADVLVGGLLPTGLRPAAWVLTLPTGGAVVEAGAPYLVAAADSSSSSPLPVVFAQPLGDFDGDGAPDLVLGRSHRSNGVGRAEIVPVWFGEPAPPIAAVLSSEWPTWRGWMETPGDLDGDGFDDLLLARLPDPEGGVRVLWGGPGL